MTSISYDKKKKGWRLQTSLLGLRRKLWLGDITKSQAETICNHVHSLKLSIETGTSPEPIAHRWSMRVGKRIADQLAAWNMIAPRSKQASQIKLSKWCSDYLSSSENSSWSKSTRYQMGKVAALLVEVIGDKFLDRVNESDAAKFGKQVYSQSAISESHGGKQVKRARQFFNQAVKERILERNPFSGVRASTQIAQNRKAYITPSASELILEQMPSQLWRVIFCLARHCGFRVPSEILTLTWSSVDWSNKRITIRSPKQVNHAHRSVRIAPVCPMLELELRALFEMAPDGAVYVCDKYRTGSTAQFRKPLLRAIANAGLAEWPKLWMNLRASCRTDWLCVAPVHAVNEWMGHDGKVGEKHYDRIKDDDWGKVSNPTLAPTESKKPRKRSKKDE